MSAIAGLMTLDDRSATAGEVTAMVQALAHRGPDGGGIWCGGTAGLGQRVRHAAAGAPRDVQPREHASAGLVLVADARIDNRAELRSLLRLDEDETSDAALILGAYRRWGSACVARLVGDFAFALWDARARMLFCARDRMGVKPFYFHHAPRLFAFASEAKGLFALATVPRRVSEAGVARFLARCDDDRVGTLYEGVQRLPAAHTLTVSEGGVRLSRYWSADAAPDVRFAAEGEYAEAFRDLFTGAVRDRLRGVDPVGATLSGGLDSSSITCTARGLAGETGRLELHTFSLVFPGLPPEDLRLIDERRYVDAVVRGGGVRSHLVRGDRLTPLGDMQRVLWHLDEPYYTPNLYLHRGMYAAARAAGVRVLLDGFDGDTAVSHGLGRLDSLLRAGDWPVFEAEVRAFAGHRGIAPAAVLPHYGLPHLAALARRGDWRAWARAARELRRRFGARGLLVDHGLRPGLPDPLRRLWRAVRGPVPNTGSLLRPALARHLPTPEIAEADGPPGEREAHLAGLGQPLFQLTLEIADKSAAQFGVEPRYPFFDTRLMEFCVGLPPEQKLAGGWTRLTFRRAMEGVLPPEVQRRADKGNLTANFQRALRAADRAAVEAVSAERLAPYVDGDRLREVTRRYLARPASGRADADAYLLFGVVTLDTWLADLSPGVGAPRPRMPVAA